MREVEARVRGPWIPEYTAQMVHEVGGVWPSILVEKWEYNSIGERRFVESRFYYPPLSEADEIVMAMRPEAEG